MRRGQVKTHANPHVLSWGALLGLLGSWSRAIRGPEVRVGSGRLWWRVRLGLTSWADLVVLWIFVQPLGDALQGLIAATEVIIYVVTSLGPCILGLGDFNDLDAEAAPELDIAMSSFPAAVELLLDRRRVQDGVLLGKMIPETLPAVADLSAHLCRIWLRMVTIPRLELVVLDAFVSLPVVLAAKNLSTVGERATVRLRVPLKMLPKGAY